MDHDYDHETTTGFIKIDNQTIFTQKFAKKTYKFITPW